MANLKQTLQQFIKEYKSSLNQILYKVVIPNGKGMQIRKQGFLSHKDALDFAQTNYLKVLTNKGLVPNANLSFGEYASSWLEYKKRNGLAVATQMRYDDYLNYRLLPYFGNLKLNSIEKSHLRNFINELQSRKVSTSLVKHSVSIFKSIMKQAEIDDLVDHKGLLIVPTPKHKNADPLFWDYSQMSFFLNTIKGTKYYELWTLTLFTGMRAGEIAGLKWDCVYLDKTYGGYTGALEVRRMFNQKTKIIQEHTKNGDRRIIPILPQAREVLEKLKQNIKGEFVLGGELGLDSSHFSRTLKSVLRKFPNLPLITFHNLRHSFCSYLDYTGVNRRVISQIMGHRDLNTTNRYSHINDQILGNEISRWAQEQSKQKTNNLALAQI